MKLFEKEEMSTVGRAVELLRVLDIDTDRKTVKKVIDNMSLVDLIELDNAFETNNLNYIRDRFKPVIEEYAMPGRTDVKSSAEQPETQGNSIKTKGSNSTTGSTGSVAPSENTKSDDDEKDTNLEEHNQTLEDIKKLAGI